MVLVNNVAAHGIPDNRLLENGDIINIDVTVYLDGFHGDCSDTFLIGDTDEYAGKLVNVTKECLSHAIQSCGPGKKLTGKEKQAWTDLAKPKLNLMIKSPLTYLSQRSIYYPV